MECWTVYGALKSPLERSPDWGLLPRINDDVVLEYPPVTYLVQRSLKAS